MRRRMAFAWVAALTLLAGCATHWDVDSFEAPEGKVGSHRTFFWKGGEFGSAGPVSPAMVAAATTEMRTAVTTELARKGYSEVDSAAGATWSSVSMWVARRNSCCRTRSASARPPPPPC